MPRAYILVLLFALVVPTHALGQDRQGHVWAVIELGAHPGQESAYLDFAHSSASRRLRLVSA